MNVRTALISCALLLAVLGWACEQQPTSPSALGTPAGGSLGAAGGVSLDAAGGVILGVMPDCETDDTHPSCKDGEPPEDDLQRFDVTVTSTSGHISSATQRTNGRGAILVLDFTLDLKTFFVGKLDNCEATGTRIGAFEFLGFDPPFILFQFTHEDIKYGLSLDGTVNDLSNWPPTVTSNFMMEDPPGNGHWEVIARGRNHKDGCTGEGDGLVYRATVDPV